MQIPGVVDVHELHIWRLDQKKTLASAHLVLADDSNIDFNKLARTINECFHAYGIHSITLQPELVRVQGSDSSSSEPLKVAPSWYPSRMHLEKRVTIKASGKESRDVSWIVEAPVVTCRAVNNV